MADYDIAAWIILLTGIYSIAASVGELRKPGMWLSMIDNIAGTVAIRFLTGIVLIAMGGAVYLVGSWDTDDWMVIVVKVLGGWMIIEGALFLAFGDAFIAFGRKMMAAATRVWALLSLVLGIALTIAAVLRL